MLDDVFLEVLVRNMTAWVSRRGRRMPLYRIACRLEAVLRSASTNLNYNYSLAIYSEVQIACEFNDTIAATL